MTIYSVVVSCSTCSFVCGYGTLTRTIQCRSPFTLTYTVYNDFCDSSAVYKPQPYHILHNCGKSLLRSVSQKGIQLTYIVLHIRTSIYSIEDVLYGVYVLKSNIIIALVLSES